MSTPTTTIRVRTDTRDRLYALQGRTDSYDDVIRWLLDAYTDDDRVRPQTTESETIHGN